MRPKRSVNKKQAIAERDEALREIREKSVEAGNAASDAAMQQPARQAEEQVAQEAELMMQETRRLQLERQSSQCCCRDRRKAAMEKMQAALKAKESAEMKLADVVKSAQADARRRRIDCKP